MRSIFLALMLAIGTPTDTTVHDTTVHDTHSLNNGYSIISQVSGIQVSCLRCGHKLDENKLCNNKNCSANAYEIHEK